MSTPKFSVLMPTYRYARYLPEAIESVLTQEFENFELLIVDYVSPDGTQEVVQPYCNRDQRIRFEVNPTNLGMVANWNACLKKARGEYVKFLFGDDKLADRRALGKLAAMLDSSPSIALASSARRVIDEASRLLETWDRWQKSGCHDGSLVMLECLRTAHNLVGEPTAVMFRRSLAQRGFDPAYRQLVDLEMWFHLLEQGEMSYTQEELCCFRRHYAQQTEANRIAPQGIGQPLIGHQELLSLFSTCCERAWYSSTTGRQRAATLWSLRRLRHLYPPAEFNPVENRFRAMVPRRLLVAYWLGHRASRPFQNLSRSLGKRIARRDTHPETIARP